jgi:hypothetical protein
MVKQSNSPIGIVEASWDGVFEVSVARFAASSAVHRQRLFNNAVMVCNRILDLGCAASVLIDGSFVTEKPFPADVDIWIFANCLEGRRPNELFSLDWLNQLRDESKRQLDVDVYLFPAINGIIVDNLDKEGYDQRTVAWFIEKLGEWFVAGYDDEPPKGAFLLRL